jgi:hypothetical protein
VTAAARTADTVMNDAMRTIDARIRTPTTLLRAARVRYGSDLAARGPSL